MKRDRTTASASRLEPGWEIRNIQRPGDGIRRRPSSEPPAMLWPASTASLLHFPATRRAFFAYSRRQVVRCVALLSGGLDSKLAIRIMQQQLVEVEALTFKTVFTCCQDQ